MVKTVTAWKLNWFKNDDEHGGAMASAIADCPPNHIVIHSQTVKFGRMWAHTTPDHLLELQKTNKGLYEVITGFPHKLYFDIDRYGDADEKFLDLVKNQIQTVFPGIQYVISGSVKPEKTSYHIVAKNYIIQSVEEQLTIRAVMKKMCQDNEAFDWKVYTKNRNMKCHGQSKDDGRVQSIIEGDNWKDHCITCFLPENHLPYQFTEEIKEEIFVNKSRQAFDIATLPKMKLACPDGIYFSTITATQILSLLPLDKTSDHNYTHRVARFCNANSIPFLTFLSWLQNKHKEIHTVKQKWLTHWNNLHKFPPVSIDSMKELLVVFYPNFKKDDHYRRFSDSFVLDTPIVKIDRITSALFEGPFTRREKNIVFNVGMGGGKTAQTVAFLKGKSFCWIAPNKALAHNTYNRLQDAEVEVTHYLTHKTADKKQGSLTQQKAVIVVANSLHYLFDKAFDIVVIDESETVLHKWFGTFMKQKKENWAVWLGLLRRAQKVICLDAFTTSQTINMLRQTGGDTVVFERKDEPMTRTINYVPSFQTMIHDMIADLNAGLKLFIFYPFKHRNKMVDEAVSMIELHTLLTEQTQQKGLYYNADIDETAKLGLRNVNEAWSEVAFVITNSMITCGVNYDSLDFDKEYLFIASFSSPRDVVQVSYRPRHLTTNQINVCFAGKMLQTNTWEDDTKTMDCPIYSSVIDGVLVEKKAPLRKSFQLFCDKAHYRQQTDKRQLEKVLKDEIDKLLEHELTAVYENIEDIDYKQEERITAKLFSGEATMLEKYQIQKYHFKSRFNYMEGDCEKHLETAWNDRECFFFEQIGRTLVNPDSLFNVIKREWNLPNLFGMPKKPKFSEEVLDRIFTEFKFKFLTKKSSHGLIAKEIYNTFFGVKIVESVHSALTASFEENIEDARKAKAGEKRNHNVVYAVAEERNDAYKVVQKYHKDRSNWEGVEEQMDIVLGGLDFS